jgi:hypothetical protein
MLVSKICYFTMVLMVTLGVAIQAEAGKRLNCNRDTSVDSPMTLTYSFVSPAKLKLTAHAGYDRSGLKPALSQAYHIYDSLGKQVGVFTENNMFDNDLMEVYVQGLVPGQNYEAHFYSIDGCFNYGWSVTNIEMPLIAAEAIAPVFDAEIGLTKLCTFFACTNYLQIFAHDETAIARVLVKIDGTTVIDHDLSLDNDFWFAAGTVMKNSTLVGEQFTYFYNKIHSGNRLVEVQIFDVFGNSSTKSKQMNLPSQL